MPTMPPILVAELFPEVTSRLLELLRSLSPDEWHLATVSSRRAVKDNVSGGMGFPHSRGPATISLAAGSTHSPSLEAALPVRCADAQVPAVGRLLPPVLADGEGGIPHPYSSDPILGRWTPQRDGPR